MGCLAVASAMLLKNPEMPRKRTLRERIYEELVHLILSGELPSGGLVDEKQGDRQIAGEPNPVPRGDRDIGKGWAGQDKTLSRPLCAQFFAQRGQGSPRIIQAG